MARERICDRCSMLYSPGFEVESICPDCGSYDFTYTDVANPPQTNDGGAQERGGMRELIDNLREIGEGETVPNGTGRPYTKGDIDSLKIVLRLLAKQMLEALPPKADSPEPKRVLIVGEPEKPSLAAILLTGPPEPVAIRQWRRTGVSLFDACVVWRDHTEHDEFWDHALATDSFETRVVYTHPPSAEPGAEK